MALLQSHNHLQGFPYPVDKTTGRIDDAGFMSDENIFQHRPYPLHQCAENIHLRINNKNITSYPMQTLNQEDEVLETGEDDELW